MQQDNVKDLQYDVVIVGCGVSGLFTALHLPHSKKILMISKADLEQCDSMLAQGGICVLVDDDDYTSYLDDTMRAGHYENRKNSVDIMIRSSRDIINQLIDYGVRFERNPDGSLAYTKEGAHSRPRICFHKDITGKEITSVLLKAVQKLPNVTIMEYTTMVDIIESYNRCKGIIATTADGTTLNIYAQDTVFATGGIGGLYKHSTNYPILTGDGCSIAKKHGVELENMDYVQIHPTCFYTQSSGRRFLISESARGEGAIILNHKGERFVDELQPRDIVTAAIKEEMKKENVKHEYLSFENVPTSIIEKHFPNIYSYCMSQGYNILKQPIPIVPAQHYFMGGIYVDSDSRTTMQHLYAVGETSCNGVHGKNRLASNSLLESLVFAERAANAISK